MRRPIRPFVKEYKSRSPKPAPRDAEAADVEPRPRFLEAPTPSPRLRDDHDDSYEAAMRAADLIFGKKITAQPAAPFATPEMRSALAEAEAMFAPEAPAAVAEPAPPPAAPIPAAPSAGRILPSLIESEFTPRREDEEEARPVRKRGRPRKTPLEPQKTESAALDFIEPVTTDEPAEPVRRAPRRPSRKLVEQAAVEPSHEPSPSLEDAEEEEDAVGSRRARRPIQARWVRRTELAAGEKWKRRLPDSLRSR